MPSKPSKASSSTKGKRNADQNTPTKQQRGKRAEIEKLIKQAATTKPRPPAWKKQKPRRFGELQRADSRQVVGDVNLSLSINS